MGGRQDKMENWEGGHGEGQMKVGGCWGGGEEDGNDERQKDYCTTPTGHFSRLFSLSLLLTLFNSLSHPLTFFLALPLSLSVCSHQRLGLKASRVCWFYELYHFRLSGIYHLGLEAFGYGDKEVLEDAAGGAVQLVALEVLLAQKKHHVCTGGGDCAREQCAVAQAQARL